MTRDLMHLPSQQRARIREAAISYSDVVSRLRYCPESGNLYWRVSFSNVLAGSKAGTLHAAGYLIVSISRQRFLAHRLVWLLSHQAWPDGEIDHIDGNTKNNRIENLRVVSASLNQRNKKIRPDNTSGHQGVSWDKSRGRWLVMITINGAQKNYGSFKSREAAIATAKAVYAANGFSKRHAEGS